MARPKKSKVKRRSKWIAARLSLESVRRLDNFAEQQDLSRSQIVRAAVNEFIDKREAMRAA